MDSMNRMILAMLLISQGKSADARPHLNQALLIQPDFPEAKQALDKLRESAK